MFEQDSRDVGETKDGVIMQRQQQQAEMPSDTLVTKTHQLKTQLI